MIDVFLLLGSNLGNRIEYLEKAVELIARDVAPISRSSALYETQSWGKTDEPDYLNQVVELQTGLSAQALLQKVLAIEIAIGRTRHIKWGSRVIDIDILFYGDAVINEPGLVVPHPELHNRRFTLEPLVELVPHLIHPLLKKNILQLKSELKDDLIVNKL
ncbi:2-amino-4-hydroxy-6-hydroxymethyldihydropteridine diphosphokinase [Mucilaginibacter glaciei]|uniref:2-amino-4-hydroxy-6-hydroxymethyldihydropteridine pyrophosphokinase n=1 Tax=Mucilaginibacter glaciei TaxID=2772109 RepID=A0A926S377_9SPHI|nr:2-amino-4-hydroxy-6-hydroxymethyldihydropteridine diphosphokinase [Mucilaginibacter glaciei]MBD1394928.1 2-amino-4-hydroxy-6-hydroxymethyldihydropteridine diphosphokinase [Mucilaginibacter glaciei]